MNNWLPPLDPSRYIRPIAPDGFIELTEALEAAVKRWFGPEYTSHLSPQLARAEIAKPKRHQRSRRYNAAGYLHLRALRSGRLATYLLKDGKAYPIEETYWRHWEAKWRPFVASPIGSHNSAIHLLDQREWNLWLDANSTKEKSSGAAPLGIVRIWFRNLINGTGRSELYENLGAIPIKDDWWRLAHTEFPQLSRRAFDRLWDELATKDMKSRGRRPKANANYPKNHRTGKAAPN